MYRAAFEETQADPFATPVEAEQAHIELVDRTRETEAAIATGESPSPSAGDKLAQLRDDIAAFEARLVATGTRLPEGSQRSLAQSILDFWALRQTDLAALAVRLSSAESAMTRPEPPMAKLLAPYDEATAIAAAAQAEERYQSLPDDTAREAACSAFISLLQHKAPLSPQEVAALEPFAESGVLSRLPPDVPGPGYGFVHEALPQAWQRLAEWQLEATKALSDLERVRSSAQAWKETQSVSELPHGEAIDVVDKLAEQDASLRDYAEAAKRRRRRERAVVWAVLGALLALVIYAVATLWNTGVESTEDEEVQATEVEAPKETIVTDRPQGDGTDTAGGSTGWIWLGSSALSQVALERGTPADPASLAKGMRVRTRANLKVRRTMPEDDGRNIAGDRIGQVSSNVIVELRGPPEAVTVNDVQQYWAEVRVIPVIYIQLDESSDAPLAELKQALASDGLQVAREQRLPQIARIDADLPFDVRYYYEQDERAARRVADIVMRWLGNSEGREADTLLPLVNSPLAERVKTGTIEVWLY